jgi:ethylmalonyl-CoA/methylmalonyl-CoA decarboxylase
MTAMMLPRHAPCYSPFVCTRISSTSRIRLNPPPPLLQTRAHRHLSNSSGNGKNSILGISRDELREIREHLRQFGSQYTENTVTLHDATATGGATSGDDAGDDLADFQKARLQPGVVSIMTLRNVKNRNALTGKMMAELADCVDTIEQNHERLTALVVRGANGFFCAGADLGIAKEHLMTREGGRLMSALMTDTLTRLYQLPVVTVAAVEGMAIGGGAELLTAMDYRIAAASNDVAIRFIHARMGVCPGWGGATRLTRLVGRRRALQLLGTAQGVNAAQALELGLMDQIVNSSESSSSMVGTLVNFLDGYIHADPRVLHAAKRCVAATDAADSSFAAATQSEHDIFCSLWGGELNQAAIMKKAATTKDSKTRSKSKDDGEKHDEPAQ